MNRKDVINVTGHDNCKVLNSNVLLQHDFWVYFNLQHGSRRAYPEGFSEESEIFFMSYSQLNDILPYWKGEVSAAWWNWWLCIKIQLQAVTFLLLSVQTAASLWDTWSAHMPWGDLSKVGVLNAWHFKQYLNSSILFQCLIMAECTLSPKVLLKYLWFLFIWWCWGSNVMW